MIHNVMKCFNYVLLKLIFFVNVFQTLFRINLPLNFTSRHMGSAVFDLARPCYDVVLYCVMKLRNFHALPVASKQTLQSDLNLISLPLTILISV